jgi:phosphoglycolate phosphatase-like HAD superfamily hydrolase
VAAPGAGVKLAIDLDGVLGDTRPLWDAWLADAGARLGVGELPADRAAAAARLDREAGNWRALLARFAADRAPVYLRPNAETTAALRRLQASGGRAAVFTDAPDELARLAVAHLGAERRVESLHAGPDAEREALAALGGGAAVVRSRDELRRLVGERERR